MSTSCVLGRIRNSNIQLQRLERGFIIVLNIFSNNFRVGRHDILVNSKVPSIHCSTSIDMTKEGDRVGNVIGKTESEGNTWKPIINIKWHVGNRFGIELHQLSRNDKQTISFCNRVFSFDVQLGVGSVMVALGVFGGRSVGTLRGVGD